MVLVFLKILNQEHAYLFLISFNYLSFLLIISCFIIIVHVLTLSLAARAEKKLPITKRDIAKWPQGSKF
jgi:hypothetical protein